MEPPRTLSGNSKGCSKEAKQKCVVVFANIFLHISELIDGVSFTHGKHKIHGTHQDSSTHGMIWQSDCMSVRSYSS